MSMSIFIYTDTSELEEGTLPIQLTEFLEQYSGYEEKSEVAQTAKLLEIDLGVLVQPVTAGSNQTEPGIKTWQDLGAIQNLVHTFLEKVNANPDFHTQVQYSEGPEMDLEKLTEKFSSGGLEGMLDMMKEQLEKLSETPATGYPLDTGYLSSGFLAQDLETLAGQLARIKKDGAKKIRFVYGE